MASVLILNQYYPPDPVPTARHVRGLAERLAADGHSVEALVGQPSYVAGQSQSPARERVGGVDVARIKLGSRTGRGSMPTRVLGYARYLAGSWWRSRRRDPDLVICFHNPPILALVAGSVARRSGARMLYVIQDIHPDIVVAAGRPRVPRPAVRLWETANRRMLADADRVVVLGKEMERILVEGKNVPAEKVAVLPPWPDPELDARPKDLEWRRAHGVSDDELQVVLAGNMGIMHPLEPLLDAAEAMADRPVRFLIVGGGVKRDHWAEQVASRGLERIRFLEHQPDEEFLRLIAAADACYVPLQEGMERYAVPSRGYAYLSAGRPVIAAMSADADLVRVLQETGSGWRVSDGSDLAELLERLLADHELAEDAGRRARAAYEESFRGSVVLDGYSGLVEELLGAGS
jgi:glycosyltransferase involved in cell wall biosynthesis